MKLHVCPSWLSFSLDNSVRRIFQNPHTILREYVTPGAMVLDIGCGPGYFTVPLAEMAGETGTVIAVDIQEKMLARMKNRAQRNGVLERIRAVQCRSDDIMVRDTVDFVLTFWMVHEVRDRRRFLEQIAGTMNKNSRYLLVEPKVHVTAKQYRDILSTAAAVGLRPVAEPRVSLSRSVLFSL